MTKKQPTEGSCATHSCVAQLWELIDNFHQKFSGSYAISQNPEIMLRDTPPQSIAFSPTNLMHIGYSTAMVSSPQSSIMPLNSVARLTKRTHGLVEIESINVVSLSCSVGNNVYFSVKWYQVFD